MKRMFFLFALMALAPALMADGITVTSPAAGVTWYRGSPYTITWTKSGAMPDTVKIRLRRWGAPESEASVADITDSTANDGSSDPWTIPNTVAAGDYFIRVRTIGDPDVIGNSGMFHISGAKFVSRIPPDRVPPLLLKFPRLRSATSNLSPNMDGFGIVFSYKNVGEGALPKASEVPVKPSSQIVDGDHAARNGCVMFVYLVQVGLAVEMLMDIHKSGDDGSKFIAAAKDKTSGKKLMGFGHRVYKNYDPRAKIIKKACDEVLKTLKISDPLLDIAIKLEEAALRDSYFVERKLYPNVDFYSGIIMRAIGIPVEMFTVMFAIGRMPGWIANYKEIMEDNKTRIYRPRQIYTGPTLNAYIPLANRK